MSEETKTLFARRQILVVANPDDGDDSSDDDLRSSAQCGLSNLPGPASTQPLKISYAPSPLTTNLPYEPVHHYTSSLSNPTLSSPSSNSSAAIESTPPPSTPSQIIPPADFTVENAASHESITSPVGPHPESAGTPARLGRRFLDKFHRKDHKSNRPSESESLHSPTPSLTSPTGSISVPYGKPFALLVTSGLCYYPINLLGAKDAAFVRERIFQALDIPEDQVTHCSIYRTEVGSSALGDALTDDQLLKLVHEHGDEKGTLKFLVAQSPSSVQELTPPSAKSLSSLVPPLNPRKRGLPKLPSRRDSVSSEDHERGYEPSLSDDVDSSDHRSTIRAPPPPIIPLPKPPVALLPTNSWSPRSGEDRSPPSPRSATTPHSSSTERSIDYSASGNSAKGAKRIPSDLRQEDHLAPERSRLMRKASETDDRDDGRLRGPDYVTLQPYSGYARSRDGAQDQNVSRKGRDKMQENSPSCTSGNLPTKSREESHRNMHRNPSKDMMKVPQVSPKQPASSTKRPPRNDDDYSNLDFSPPVSTSPVGRRGGQPVPSHFISRYLPEQPKVPSTSASANGTPWPLTPVKGPKSAKSHSDLRSYNGSTKPQQSSIRPSTSRTPLSSPAVTGQTSRPPRPLPPTSGQAVPPHDNSSLGLRSPVHSPPINGSSLSLYPPSAQEPYTRPHSAAPMQSPSRSQEGFANEREIDNNRGFNGPLASTLITGNGTAIRLPSLPIENSSPNGPLLTVRPLPQDPGSQSAITHSKSESLQTPPRSPVKHVAPQLHAPSPSMSPSTSTPLLGPSKQNTYAHSPDHPNFDSTLRPEDVERIVWNLPKSNDDHTRVAPNGFSQDIANQSPAHSRTTSTYDDISPSGTDTWTSDLWVRRMIDPVATEQAKNDSRDMKAGTRPPSLTVNTNNPPSTITRGNYTVPGVPANFPPPPSQPPPALRPSTPKDRKNHKRPPYENSWVRRPNPEEMYDRLEKFFPGHDLDNPVIEAGGSSPTAVEHPSIPPLSFERERGLVKGKKSLRIVAEEHKKRIDRTSRGDASTFASDVMRKRSTKLWGSRLEEVTTAQSRTHAHKPAPESPSGGPKPIFKWVRGDLIGKGTYGRVYYAMNATTGEMIAVKQVEIPWTTSDKSDARQASFVQALKSESEILKDLDHPNIVQYLGFEETPSVLSIFLEYVPGGSIGSCLQKHGKFDEEVTKSFTGQILAGLDYLHSKGILHRDLKADNILVEASGICKISDFGISKRTDEGGAHTALKGTVFWMAPEMVDTQEKGYNSKVDIWSVGCVVLEMWAGKRPWSEEEAIVVMLKLYQSKQPPPIPDDVILSELAMDFKDKCFVVDPEARASAAELRYHPYLELPPGWTFNDFK